MRSPLAATLIAALLYFATACASTLLAVPLQTATAIWPPAGIALAALIFTGYRGLPGILLGAFAFNACNFAFRIGTGDPATALLFGVAMGGGAAMQALVGYGLVRRFVGKDSSLSTARDILLFLLLAGPVSCVVSPLLGNFLFSLFGTLPADTFRANLITFWMGDALGALLIAPIAQVIHSGSAPSIRTKRIVRVALPTSVCVLATFLMFRFAGIEYHVEVKRSFQKMAGAAASRFHDSLDRNLASLEALRAYIESSEAITEAEFDRFCDRLLNERLGVRALSWNPLIRHDALEDFREALSAHYGRPIELRSFASEGSAPLSPGETDRHCIVQHIFPREGNETAIGLDLMSEPTRRGAIETALLTGGFASTSHLDLVQEEAGHSSVIIFAPVRESDSEQFSSTVSLVIDLDQMLERVLVVDLQGQMAAILLDTTEGQTPHELAAVGEIAQFDDPGMRERIEGASGVARCPFSERYSISAPERHWQLHFLATSRFAADHTPWQPELVLVVGTLFVVVLGALLLLETGQQAAIEELVEERTESLQAANDRLAAEVAERQRAEEAAHAARVEAEDANAAKSRFLANMSHEIRTPMTAILGFSELLARANLPPPHAHGATTIHRASDALLGILNSILDFAKVESGHMELIARPTDPRVLFEECAQLFRASAEAKHLEYAWRIDREVPPCVAIDAMRVRQIVNNLLGNAVKFTPAGSIWMRVGTTSGAEAGDVQVPENGVALTITVRDTGPGIPADFRERMFEPFRRATTSTSPRDEASGTGLGLAICTQLTALMGGRISVESREGEGTTMRVVIPAAVVSAPAPAGAEGQTAESGDRDQGGVAPLRGARELRVLIGEDNSLSAQVVESMLRRLGFEMLDLADDGDAAVEMARRDDYDIIMLDGWMPRRNGAEAAQAIREIERERVPAGRGGGRRARIIAFSASALEDDEARFRAAGADVFLPKPFRLAELRDCLARLLDAEGNST
jgi:signal transduction histidine kinase